jgi:aspartate/methionine/tyrosine aminotransferase
VHDLKPFFPTGEAVAKASFSEVALGMEPSRILAISYAVKEAIARGAQVTQFTVGDFAPDQFPIPAALARGITEAIAAGQTNYPPADGLPELRKAIAASYRDELGLDYPLDGVTVASGARPGLYAIYRCLVEPGEVVVAPVPGWNNDNYTQLVGGRFVPVPSRPEAGFMPDPEALAPHLRTARLLVICSPLNPCGTMIQRDRLAAICQLILDENRRRERTGERLLYLVYDQVYRLLTFGPTHHTPVEVAPEMARYTIFVDAISKSFAATGIRVGWVVSPPFIADRLRALLTHMGAWAPRPEQRAVARLLEDREATATVPGGPARRPARAARADLPGTSRVCGRGPACGRRRPRGRHLPERLHRPRRPARPARRRRSAQVPARSRRLRHPALQRLWRRDQPRLVAPERGRGQRGRDPRLYGPPGCGPAQGCVTPHKAPQPPEISPIFRPISAP